MDQLYEWTRQDGHDGKAWVFGKATEKKEQSTMTAWQGNKQDGIQTMGETQSEHAPWKCKHENKGKAVLT